MSISFEAFPDLLSTNVVTQVRYFPIKVSITKELMKMLRKNKAENKKLLNNYCM